MKCSNNRMVTNMNTREVVIVSACRAINEGKFKDEIVPVTLKTRKGEVIGFRLVKRSSIRKDMT